MKSGNGNGWQAQLNEESIMSDTRWVAMRLPSAQYERGREEERAAIVEWLTARRNIIASGIWFAREIENGTHLRSNNE